MFELPPTVQAFVSEKSFELRAAFAALAGAWLLSTVALFLVRTAEYREFMKGHDAFARKAATLKKRVLALRWNHAIHKYFLMDSEGSKALFQQNSALDHRLALDIMHRDVWEFPLVSAGGHTGLRAQEKYLHGALRKQNIGESLEEFERGVIRLLQQQKDNLKDGGKVVPISTTFAYLNYTASLRAFWGSDLSVQKTRRDLIIVANDWHSANMPNYLPSFIPFHFWMWVLPRGRRFLNANTRLRDTLQEWEAQGGVTSSSSLCQDMHKSMMKNGLDARLRANWWNNLFFGMQANTGENMGWMFGMLLQLPKLVAAIKAEIAALPEGAMSDVDFKRSTPLLYASVYESLRFATGVYTGRYCKKDAKLPGMDQTFPAGSFLIAFTRAVHYDTSVWGEDANRWNALRFIGDEAEARFSKNLAFGGGATICPGRFMAQGQMLILSAYLLRDFEFGPVAMHHKSDIHDTLPLPVGSKAKEQPPMELVDLDGTIVQGCWASLSDTGIETLSSLMVPRYEAVCVMRVANSA